MARGRGVMPASTFNISENRQPTFQRPGFSLRKTPDLKRREAFDREQLARNPQREMTLYMDAKLRGESVQEPDFSAMRPVYERRGYDTSYLDQIEADQLNTDRANRKIESTKSGMPAPLMRGPMGERPITQNGRVTGWKKDMRGTNQNAMGGEVDGANIIPTQARRLSDQNMGPRPAAGTNAASRAQSGTRINPNSFSAGRSEWAGRVQDSVAGADTTKVDSLRDNWKTGSGATAGVRMLSQGSLMDGGILGRNRQEAFKPIAAKAADAEWAQKLSGAKDMIGKSQSMWSSIDKSVSDITKAAGSAVAGPVDPFAKGTANMSTEEMQAADEKLYGVNTNMMGGEVDTAQYLSYAMAEGLGDPRLTQAAMKSYADPGKKYKNLRAMGVI